MKVTVVSGSLAHNGIARPWILAQLLSRHYEVEAIGRLRSGESVWPGFADYPWRVVREDGLVRAVDRLERQITSEFIVAYGMSLLSFGTALLAKRRRGLRVLLDMPEWEVHEHFNSAAGLRRALMIGRKLVGPGWADAHSFKYRYLLDHLTWLADERTVCCEFLRARYGGVVLPQGPDTTRFDPSRFHGPTVRRKWGLPEDARIVFFGGNPQPMKGLSETVAALNALEGRVDCRLVIAGRDASHPYTADLVRAGRGKVVALGPQPFSVMPELLAAADLVVLWHVPNPRSRGYIPCKMYEAMAMALPVVSSSHSDVPTILEGCGYVVESNQPSDLQATIEHVLAHPEDAAERGRRARQRVIDRYGWSVMDRTLHATVERLVASPRGVAA